eukprot:3158908-Lingulodinium_polyedra.AAC.1
MRPRVPPSFPDAPAVALGMAPGCAHLTLASAWLLGAPMTPGVGRTPRGTPPSASADLPLPTQKAQRCPSALASP